MPDTSRILKNSIFITGSVVLGGAILFLNFVLVARYLGPELLGSFVLVLSAMTLLQLFADGGLVTILIRELARSETDAAHVLGATRALVWSASVALAAAGVPVVSLLDPSPDLAWTVLWMGLASLAAVQSAVNAAVLRAREDMGVVAIVNTTHKVLLLALVFTAIKLDVGMPGVAFVHLAANAALWAVTFIVVRTRYLAAPLRFLPSAWRYMMREALPLGGGMVLRKLAVHMNVFLLTILATAGTVGLFNAAYRLPQMIEIGSTALAGVLFPALSRLAVTSRDDFYALFAGGMQSLVLIGVGGAGWLVLAAGPVLNAADGDAFVGAHGTLVVLGFSLAFLVPGALLHAVFSALDRQHYFLRVTAVGVCVNAVLNLILIPQLEHLGAAFATLSSEIVTLAVGITILSRLDVPTAALPRVYGKALLAVAIGSVPLLLLQGADSSVLSLVLASAAYFAIYGIVSIATGLLQPRDLLAALRPRPPVPTETS
jgi:O-antigen/teichoic acid export membrane protein